jgi:hypothetical protein
LFYPNKKKNVGLNMTRATPSITSVPIALNKYIYTYLDKVRSVLIKEKIDTFWVNTVGTSMRSKSFLSSMQWVGRTILQKELSVRLLRLNLNNEFRKSNPSFLEKERFNQSMDHTETTANDYYVIWEMEENSHQNSNPLPFIQSLMPF